MFSTFYFYTIFTVFTVFVTFYNFTFATNIVITNSISILNIIAKISKIC